MEFKGHATFAAINCSSEYIPSVRVSGESVCLLMELSEEGEGMHVSDSDGRTRGMTEQRERQEEFVGPKGIRPATPAPLYRAGLKSGP